MNTQRRLLFLGVITLTGLLLAASVLIRSQLAQGQVRLSERRQHLIEVIQQGHDRVSLLERKKQGLGNGYKKLSRVISDHIRAKQNGLQIIVGSRISTQHQANQVRSSITELEEYQRQFQASSSAVLQPYTDAITCWKAVISDGQSEVRSIDAWLNSAWFEQFHLMLMGAIVDTGDSPLRDCDSGGVFLDRYHLPDLPVSVTPTRRISILDALAARSLSDAMLLVKSFGKEIQAWLLEVLKGKQNADLADLRVGSVNVTLDAGVADALWHKYVYFLLQTYGTCEIRPTSSFRDVLKQRELQKIKGQVVAKPFDSLHATGHAIDIGRDCQAVTVKNRRVPFDFDERGEVIYVEVGTRSTNSRKYAIHNEPEVREAVLQIRRAEFYEDYEHLKQHGGDLSAWEESQFRSAIDELLSGEMGIYGAHVMSFEAGLKAGLVGAFCSVVDDPVHSAVSISDSTAECGPKREGKPPCYTVKAGIPDCWRGSQRWKERIESLRKKHWGARYNDLYGPRRLDRFLHKQNNPQAH